MNLSPAGKSACGQRSAELPRFPGAKLDIGTSSPAVSFGKYDDDDNDGDDDEEDEDDEDEDEDDDGDDTDHDNGDGDDG